MTKRHLPPNIYRHRASGRLYFAKRIAGRLHHVTLETQFPEGAPVPFALHQERERLLAPNRAIRIPFRPEKPAVSLEKRLLEAVKSAKARAKKQGVPFALEADWAVQEFNRANGICAVTGVRLEYRKKHDPWGPSIDRIVPKYGYTPKNCRLVAYIYNCARNQFSDDDLRKLCEALTR